MTHADLDPDRAANLAENPHAGQGPVPLDIGDNIGAIVLHLTADLEGAEVEIETADHNNHHQPGHHHSNDDDHHHDHEHEQAHRHTHRPHVAVVGRPVAYGLAYTAVFPALQAGRYVLSLPGQQGRLVVQVRGGEVSEVRWAPT